MGYQEVVQMAFSDHILNSNQVRCPTVDDMIFSLKTAAIPIGAGWQKSSSKSSPLVATSFRKGSVNINQNKPHMSDFIMIDAIDAQVGLHTQESNQGNHIIEYRSCF
jgi:hypothetical protein